MDVSAPVMEPVEQIMRMMEAHEEEEHGWDARPLYFFLFMNKDLGMGAANLEMPPDLYEDPANRLPILAHYMAKDDAQEPNLALEELGRLMKYVYKRMIRSLIATAMEDRADQFSFYGVGLVNEAWSVDSDDGSGRSPSERPDRVEIRMVTVVTVDGRIATLSRKRGGTPEFRETDPGMDENGKDSGWSLYGRVPDALRLLCDGLERATRD